MIKAKKNVIWSVIANYLEIASVRKDTQFRDALSAFIQQKVIEGSEKPLAAANNYGNIVILESFGEARKSGGVVG